MLFKLFVLLAAAAPYTLADVQSTFPTAGARETGNTAVYIGWKEFGTGLIISSFGQYNLNLCAGGNDAGSYVRDKLAAMQVSLGLVSAVAENFYRKLNYL